jgi:hypothetical protein
MAIRAMMVAAVALTMTQALCCPHPPMVTTVMLRNTRRHIDTVPILLLTILEVTQQYNHNHNHNHHHNNNNNNSSNNNRYVFEFGIHLEHPICAHRLQRTTSMPML